MEENKLGKYIKERRGDLSLRDFAQKCGISHTHIDSIEKGFDPRTGKKVKITIDILNKLANALDVDADYLLELSLDQVPKYGENLDGIYLRLARTAQEKGLSPNDVNKIINLYQTFKENDKK